ncbi:tetraacyldisaccharide 4'-kinase [Acetobacter cibinongensis]|uniref:Tetraacyldisaccharide 4'-kinase n=1 Tax=Acetobacter cibinongensis TaxID=146475 RepID=A0A0D6N693_9PROT|nr:tetraacyldisaccharide 4'-kinase [Acetobacter cibinongensis]GAN61225.1 tetraacyldisaccharide 4'-kinase [Acetobacter cibinongensis]GBQ17267.1 tetraacyldisaccharide 4'-kinase [Acetobacter cibinongensis NRIC 0482]GEL57881.1 tetraacyldisaccharide 4'-kinase [Acetobacter cibinongensis]
MSLPPRFWLRPDARFLPLLLTPLAKVVANCAAKRQQRAGWLAPIPVLCCGNLTTGGTGKTTVVLDLMTRLQAQDIDVHVLTRGYKGRLKGPVRVTPHHTARDVGDEALLLAHQGPTWVGGDRAATAQAAVKSGAQCLIMDDGFQNPTLHKTLSLLVVDGAVGLGNGHVMPAGPLREGITAGLKSASAVLVIGKDQTGFLERYADHLPPKSVYTATLETMVSDLLPNKAGPYIAFAGLGRPSKFFDGLRGAGIQVLKAIAFPDHYRYRSKDMKYLLSLAETHHAELVTTPKDAVRLPNWFRQRVKVVNVALSWDDLSAPENLLHTLMSKPRI